MAWAGKLQLKDDVETVMADCASDLSQDYHQAAVRLATVTERIETMAREFRHDPLPEEV